MCLVHPLLFIGTANGPEMAFLTGLIGYTGKYICCLYCGLSKQYYLNFGMYYPMIHKPDNCKKAGHNHDTSDINNLPWLGNGAYYKNPKSLLPLTYDNSIASIARTLTLASPLFFLVSHAVLSLSSLFFQVCHNAHWLPKF